MDRGPFRSLVTTNIEGQVNPSSEVHLTTLSHQLATKKPQVLFLWAYPELTRSQATYLET
jgi:hypothetical protein